MAKITSNTQIDTINILTEVNSANDTDLILLQRGLVSHKMKKQNLIIPISQIAPIGNNTVLGNVSGSSAAPSEVTVLDSNDASSNLDTAIVTEKRIKEYINNNIVDFKYEAITGGTVSLSQNTNGTYNYTISQFTGVSDTSKIRDIYLSIDFTSVRNDAVVVYATFPDGTEYAIAENNSGDSADPHSSQKICIIPVNSNQMIFSFRILDSGSGFVDVNIIGCRILDNP